MNDIIIKIERGVVAEVYSTGPVNVIVVDRDVISGRETFEDCMVKAVTMRIERRLRPEDVGMTVKSLVLERRRLAVRRLQEGVDAAFEAGARVSTED